MIDPPAGRPVERREDEVRVALAQLRHAYQQLVGGHVKNQLAFAEGMLAPQIRRLERLAASPVPCAEPPADEESAEDTLKSIATMLGWMNVPPRETLERSIAALKARATRPPAEGERDDDRDATNEQFGSAGRENREVVTVGATATRLPGGEDAMTIESREVLAAAYLGPLGRARKGHAEASMLRHAVFADSRGYAMDVLCRRVALDNLADRCAGDPSAPPTCSRCLQRLRAGRLKGAVNPWMRHHDNQPAAVQQEK